MMPETTNRMVNLCYKNIHYLETPNIIDTDNENDGVHFIDLTLKDMQTFCYKS